MHPTIKAADVNELERQIVWSTVDSFIITTTCEFTNPTDLESMHYSLIDALKTLDTYAATNNDVVAMKAFAIQLFHSASSRVTIDYKA
jgi:hypothetical protein